MPLLLDSTVLIDALRGRPAAGRLRELNARRVPLLTTAINVEEIVRGLRPRETEAATDLFTAVRVLPVARQHGVTAGAWRRQFAERGITLQQADCLVAACAYDIAARLATGNPEDFPMPELTVEHWPVGT
jgi:predicted nucleic acid-binding protein